MRFEPGGPLAQCLLLATVTGLSTLTPAALAANDLPVYPAAKTQPLPPGIHSVTSRCGHTFTVQKSMTADADPHAIAKWYQSRLPGSRTIDLTRVINDEEGGAGDQMTSIEVFSADGSQTVVVNRMNFGRSLVNASKMIGADKANIGIEGISPPFAPEYIELTAQAAACGAAAKKAKQQMEAACKG